MPSNPIEIYGLHCVACDGLYGHKESITMMLCPVCEQAAMRAYPRDFFLQTQPIELTSQAESLELLEAFEYAEAV